MGKLTNKQLGLSDNKLIRDSDPLASDRGEIMKLTPIKDLANEHLLNEFEDLARWAGDDFAVDQIPPKMQRRAAQARKEILRRMS